MSKSPRTITQKRMVQAYRKGYRVTPEGKLINPKGMELAVRLYGSQRYAVFTVLGKSIPVHQFAALCFFGFKAWETECIRHLDDNPLNNCRSNITLGTHVENEADKVRVPKRVLSDRQVRICRRAYGSKQYTISELAAWTGVSWWTMSRAVRGQREYETVTTEVSW